MTNEPRSPANEHDATDAGRDAMSETQITLHEKLCAYILGEANDDERAEVERALTMSAELRAERESLEATIGLVRNSMSKSETLSPEATAGVLSRATVKKSRPWYFSMPMRIAAGIVALTIAYALYESHDWRSTAERVAGLDSSSRSRRALGSAADSSLLAKAELKQATEPRVEPSVAGESRAATAPSAPTPSSEERSERELFAALPSEANQPASSANSIGNAARDGRALQVIDRADANRESNAARDSAEIVDSQAIGVGTSAQSLADKKTGTYRGATDAGASTGAASGPSSYGRSSEGSRALGSVSSGQPYYPRPASRPAADKSAFVTGGDNYYLGASGKAAAKDKLAHSNAPALKGLGYTSGPGSAESTDGSAHSTQPLRGLGYAGDNDESVKRRALEDAVTDFVDNDDAAKIKALQESLKEYRPEHHKYQEIQEEMQRLESRRALTPEQRELFIDQQCRLILERCHRQPNERPRDMYFRFWGDNAFQLALLEPQSTFSADVDTASYALARRYLNEGQLPEKAQVRTEEFVNYFKPDVAAPREGTFAIQTELAPSRFSNDANRSMLRVVVRGREVTKQERKPLALTFVIDCSGSMVEQNRLEMVKHAIRLLLTQLDGNDSIAIVAFSSDARMILPMTSASRRDLIESAIHPLKPENSTNSEAGLKMGYEAALAGLNANANNRVVFLSDGVANVGETDPQKLAEGVKRIREKGIYLNSIGVGMNNHNDALLEQLADKGDGVCNYIDSEDEAKRVMVDNFTGAMETIARDVKIQVEFDPSRVERYRLLGYENRFIANKDFRNDKIDAGEVGAGHQVCALYELELANGAPQDVAQKPLATVRLRWKAPRDVKRPDANEEATEIERPVLASSMTSYEGASFGYKRAVIVAQFAEFLRRSSHARGRSFDDLIAEAQKLEKQGDDRDVAELVTLLEKSRSLILASLPQCDELCQTIDVIRKNQILRAERDMLSLERDQKTLDELAKQNAELEARIRELLRRKLESKSK
jgi:Ca-activated chloride channel family protein